MMCLSLNLYLDSFLTTTGRSSRTARLPSSNVFTRTSDLVCIKNLSDWSALEGTIVSVKTKSYFNLKAQVSSIRRMALKLKETRVTKLELVQTEAVIVQGNLCRRVCLTEIKLPHIQCL